MYFKRFFDDFPEIAEKETRRLFLKNDPKIPDGEYAFLDSYCEDRHCDCRIVHFQVIQIDPDYKSMLAATISYGWEDLDFYRSWSPNLSAKMVADMKGPILQPGQKQSQHAEYFLDFFASKMLLDPAYIERIRRHYIMFKAKLGGKAIKKICKGHKKFGPCPCGSGKKMKFCCLA